MFPLLLIAIGFYAWHKYESGKKPTPAALPVAKSAPTQAVSSGGYTVEDMMSAMDQAAQASMTAAPQDTAAPVSQGSGGSGGGSTDSGSASTPATTPATPAPSGPSLGTTLVTPASSIPVLSKTATAGMTSAVSSVLPKAGTKLPTTNLSQVSPVALQGMTKAVLGSVVKK